MSLPQKCSPARNGCQLDAPKGLCPRGIIAQALRWVQVGRVRLELLERGMAEKLGFRLDQVQLDQFHRYHEEIVAWSARANLTAVTGQDEVQTRHFLDSLLVSAAIPADMLESGCKVLDLGSGAGFPGLPLKIAFPNLALTLLDATTKKTAFLRHVTTLLGLGGVAVRTGRAEAMGHEPDLRESYDVVVSRAVARLSVLAELSLPFCRLGGLSIAQKGRDIDDELSDAEKAIETSGGVVTEVRETDPGGTDGSGLLVVMEKKSLTPDRYPRRAGIPAKRPI